MTTRIADRAPHGMHDHRHPVDLQQRVDETRRLLLEAADRLLDLDEVARSGQREQALSLLHQAVALTSASGQQLELIEQRMATAARPRPDRLEAV